MSELVCLPVYLSVCVPYVSFCLRLCVCEFADMHLLMCASLVYSRSCESVWLRSSERIRGLITSLVTTTLSRARKTASGASLEEEVQLMFIFPDLMMTLKPYTRRDLDEE